MTFNIDLFLAAIALLCLPLPHSVSKAHAALGYKVRTPHGTLGGMARTWQNWLDLARGAAGAYLLMDQAIDLPAPTPGSQLQVLGIQAGVLVSGLLLQVLRIEGGLRVFAPVFYLSGVTTFLVGSIESDFALLFGWAFALGMRDPRLQLPVMGVALAAAGYFFGGLRPVLTLNCALIFAPLLLAVLCQKRLLFVSLVRNSAGLYHSAVAPVTAGAPSDSCAAAYDDPVPAAAKSR
jgi:hypothetical protein